MSLKVNSKHAPRIVDFTSSPFGEGCSFRLPRMTLVILGSRNRAQKQVPGLRPGRRAVLGDGPGKSCAMCCCLAQDCRAALDPSVGMHVK